MMPFDMLSAFARSLFALWAFLLCLLDIGSAVLASARRRYRFAAFATLFFIPVYYMWQVLFDHSLFGRTDNAAIMTSKLCGYPCALWLAALALLTFASLMLLARNIKYDKSFITPNAIKLYLDKVPCGICCWCDSGRVLFTNICMNELCAALTGDPLINGVRFSGAVKDEIMTVCGRVWRFPAVIFS